MCVCVYWSGGERRSKPSVGPHLRPALDALLTSFACSTILNTRILVPSLDTRRYFRIRSIFFFIKTKSELFGDLLRQFLKLFPTVCWHLVVFFFKTTLYSLLHHFKYLRAATTTTTTMGSQRTSIKSTVRLAIVMTIAFFMASGESIFDPLCLLLLLLLLLLCTCFSLSLFVLLR